MSSRRTTRVDTILNVILLASAVTLLFCKTDEVTGTPRGDVRPPADPWTPPGDPWTPGDASAGDSAAGDPWTPSGDAGGDAHVAGDPIGGDHVEVLDCTIVSPSSGSTFRRREPVRLAVGGSSITGVEWSSNLEGADFVSGIDTEYLDLSVGNHSLSATITYSDLSTCTTPVVTVTVVANHGLPTLTYSDLGDGTLSNGAGFTWQQQDDNTDYNWYEAAGVFDATYNASSTDVCGDLDLGGRGDWRLPTRRELLSTVDYGVASPTIDPLFLDTSDVDPYWSRDVTAASDVYAWAVSFQTGGTISYIERHADYPWVYVRCVCGTMPVGPYMVDNGDGTATDEATGLMWQVTGSDPQIWSEAAGYCDTLSLAGHDDWRLPDVRELESLVDITATTGPTAPSVLALASAGYATSTEAFGQESWLAWQVDFSDGGVEYNGKTDANYVLCVRLP